MKKIISLSLPALILTCFFASAQPFQNIYDLGADDFANMSLPSASGELFSVGSSDFSGAGGYDAFLMKCDDTGNFIWHKQYGGSGTEVGTAFRETSDGFIIAGRSTSFTGGDPDILLIKTDSLGDLQWAKTYGGSGNDFATYIQVTFDGGFIVTGQTNSYGNGQEAFLLKTDALGNVEWFNTYGSNSDELAQYVVQASDTGYIVAGASAGFGGAGQNDIYFFNTDSLGNLGLQFLIGGTEQDELRRLLETQSGSLILGGNSGNDIFVGELNTQNFAFNWFNTYGGNGADAFTSMGEVPGQGYAVSGFTNSFSTNQDQDGLLMVLQTDGTVGLNFLLEGSQDETIQDAAITQSGGLITGYSNSYGGAANNIYMFRIGNDPPCYSRSVSITVTPQSPSIAGPVLPNHNSASQSVTANVVTLTQSSATATVTDLCPDPLAADAGEDVTYCGSNPITIGGNPAAVNGTGPYTYTWSPADGLDDSTAANPSASPAFNTVYTLLVTDGMGATATDDVVVSVGQEPVVSVNPDTMTICSGESVDLVATGADTYSWTPADGLSATDIADPTASPTSSVTYMIAGTSGGCVGFASATITVLQSPDVMVTPETPAICIGNSVTLNATGALTYSWSPADGLSATNVDNPDASPTVTTTYTVTGSDSNCTTSVDVTVTVNQSPSVLVNPASATICSGESIQLTASGAASFSWSPADGLSDTAVANPIASPVSSVTYTVTGVSAGCPGSGTADVEITVNPSPDATVTSTNPLCFTGTNGTAKVVATGGSGIYTYFWSNNATTDSISGLGADTYYITVTDDNNCEVIDSAVITNPPFVRGFVSSTPSSGSNGTATVVGSGGTPPYTYEWETGDTGAGDTLTITGLAPGDYRVTTTDNNGCTDVRTINVPLAVSTAGASFTKNTLTLFPNPANEVLNVNIYSNGFSKSLLSVIAADGKTVMESELNLSEGLNSYSLNTSHIPPGLYYVRIKSAETLLLKKVVME